MRGRPARPTIDLALDSRHNCRSAVPPCGATDFRGVDGQFHGRLAYQQMLDHCALMRRWRRCWRVAAVVGLFLGGAACSPSRSTISPPSMSIPLVLATESGQPTRWTIDVKVAVSTPSGETPFRLGVDTPVVVSDLTKPTTLILRATADAPVLALFNATMFTARLQDSGTLDLSGPACQLEFALKGQCSADPVILTVGIPYADIPGPRPTGQAIDGTAIRVTIEGDALSPGSYHLMESGSWRFANDATAKPNPVEVSVDFDVKGPAFWPRTLRSKCFDSFMNDYQPDQVVPDIPNDVRAVAFELSPWPEGPGVTVNSSNSNAAIAKAFTKAAELVRAPLPNAVPQSCCNKTLLIINFSNGADAKYGPCELPSVLQSLPDMLIATQT